MNPDPVHINTLVQEFCGGLPVPGPGERTVKGLHAPVLRRTCCGERGPAQREQQPPPPVGQKAAVGSPGMP